MSTTLPTAAAMANIAAAAIGLPTPLVRLDLNGLVVISSGGLVVISCGGLVVVTGGMVVGGRGGPKGLLVQLEGLQTLTVIKEVVSSLVDAQSCVICIHIIYWHINTTAKILNIWQNQIKK